MCREKEVQARLSPRGGGKGPRSWWWMSGLEEATVRIGLASACTDEGEREGKERPWGPVK